MMLNTRDSLDFLRDARPLQTHVPRAVKFLKLLMDHGQLFKR